MFKGSGQPSLGHITRGFQLHGAAVLFEGIFVIACAHKHAPQTDMSGGERSVAFRCSLTILDRCAHPLFVMRQFVLAPVGFAEPGVRSGKTWIAFQSMIENLNGVLDVFWLDRKSTRLNSSHRSLSRMPSSA